MTMGKLVVWGFSILALALGGLAASHLLIPAAVSVVADRGPWSGMPMVQGQQAALTLPAYEPLVVGSSPNTYYVATDGIDANPGTIMDPWRHIQYAVNSVSAGDTIYVRGGNYEESVSISVSGSGGSPITLTNYQEEAVTIYGGASPAIVSYVETEYWVIDGFTLDSDHDEFTLELSAWGGGGTANGSNHWIIRNNLIIGCVRIYGHHNLFEANEVDGSQRNNVSNGNGVWELYERSHHNIYRNNHIHHFYRRGIWSMTRTHDSVFEDNHIHDIVDARGEGMGIDADGAGSVEWRHTIRGNHIHDCGVDGIALENTFDSIIENNRIHDCRLRGIVVINYPVCEVGGENDQYGDTDGDNDCQGDITENIIRQNLIFRGADHGGITSLRAGGIKVWGNTIHSCDGPGVSLNSGVQFCPEIEVRGNIIAENYGLLGLQISLYDAHSLTADDHNLLYNTGSGGVYWINGTLYSLSQYQAATGKGQGSIEASPGLVNPAGNDFHPRSDSPAIDAGVDIGLATDLDGNPRPLGTGYDIGAYEYGASVRLRAWWRDGTAYLSWTKALHPDLEGYCIYYTSETGGDADQGPSPRDVPDRDQLTLQLTGLTMHSLYELWIEPYDGNGQSLGESNHVPILPTDIFLYLPLMSRA